MNPPAERQPGVAEGCRCWMLRTPEALPPTEICEAYAPSDDVVFRLHNGASLYPSCATCDHLEVCHERRSATLAP